MNPEGLPQLSGLACILTLLYYFHCWSFNPSPRRYAPQFSPIFSCENTGEEGESNPPLIAVRYSAYGARQGEKVEY